MRDKEILKLQAELEATNRQVEILSDALAESRREVAQLKSQPARVQEPVAYEYGDDVFWHDSPDINDYIRANGNALVYATAAQRQFVGLTDEEIEQGCKESWVTERAFQSAVWWAEAKLRSKNI